MINKQLNTINHQPLTINNRWGFTLIELLVVIAVIAMVIVVILPNFMGVRQRARDTARKSDLVQMQKAIELYKQDQNPQKYPTTGAFDTGMCNTCWSSGADCTGNVYIRKVPCDPGGNSQNPYIYERNETDDLSYTLSSCLENIVDSERDPTPIPACGSPGTSYTVHEP